MITITPLQTVTVMITTQLRSSNVPVDNQFYLLLLDSDNNIVIMKEGSYQSGLFGIVPAHVVLQANKSYKLYVFSTSTVFYDSSTNPTITITYNS